MTESITNFTDSSIPHDKKSVLLFWAPWHPDSVPGKGSMDQVLQALATSSSDDSIVQFGRVHAEECPTLTQKYSVTAVPTFVLLHADGTVFEKIEIGAGGDDVSRVTQAVQRLIANQGSTKTAAPAVEPKQDDEQILTSKLKRLISSSPVMLFMKGSPAAPRCGFSRQAVELLTEENIPFGSFDILTDEQVRQGLKKHSNWPTYPQLYVNGELVGGLDILKELKEDGSLREQLDITTTVETTSGDAASSSKTTEELLNDRLSKLVRQSRIMLFMKGLPSGPRCGFSRQMVEMLEEYDVEYEAFDILGDEEVRQGLKKYSGESIRVVDGRILKAREGNN